MTCSVSTLSKDLLSALAADRLATTRAARSESLTDAVVQNKLHPACTVVSKMLLKPLIAGLLAAHVVSAVDKSTQLRGALAESDALAGDASAWGERFFGRALDFGGSDGSCSYEREAYAQCTEEHGQATERILELEEWIKDLESDLKSAPTCDPTPAPTTERRPARRRTPCWLHTRAARWRRRRALIIAPMRSSKNT